MRIDSPIYQKAFQRYLRTGLSIEVQLKAATQESSHYIWTTVGDDKVRPEHAAREGQVFAWDDPAISPPGTEHECRCTAVPYHGIVDPPIEPVYPELALLPLFRVGRLLSAWRALGRQRAASRNWQLSPTKSPTKWRNQVEKGNWTPEKISDTIRNGSAQAVKNERTGGPATLYQKDGNFVVRDDKTGDILQLSRPGFTPKTF